MLRVSLDFSNVPAEYFGTPARQSPRFDEFSGSKKEDSSDDFFAGKNTLMMLQLSASPLKNRHSVLKMGGTA